MLTAWWAVAGSIYHTLMYLGEKITADKYVQQIDERNEKLKRLQSALMNRKGPIVLHDYAWPQVELQQTASRATNLCLIHHTSRTSLASNTTFLESSLLPVPESARKRGNFIDPEF